MSHTDCFRALGVAPDASWEEVRQAYKDLVRVWHPDRFQSDPKLRERAEQRLQKINEAYGALKNSAEFRGYAAEPAPPPASPKPAVESCPPPRRGLQFRWPLGIAWLGLLCLPLVLGSVAVQALRAPDLDSVLVRASQPRPVMLMPSRFIDPPDGRRATAEELSAWARGEAADMMRAIAKPSAGAPRAVAARPDDVAPRDPPRHRDAQVSPVLPVNGTEMLWTRRSGAGEFWVSNETSRDALATLVESHTAGPLRAIYIQAKSKVCMRNIAPGVYDLMAEVGEDWDPSHMRFRAGRQALNRSGPFQCIDVSTAQGTSGCRYDVVLRAR
jgi:hypothetical protein